MKVLHPGIREQFERDLNVMSFFASAALWLFPSLGWLSPRESLSEFRRMMTGQVDLRVEADNLARFRRDFDGDDCVVFPMPMPELSSRKVLVETYEPGLHVGEFVEQMLACGKKGGGVGGPAMERTRKAVAAAGVDMLLKMVFRHNFVHGDLHPGNILVRGIGDESWKLVVLDPGIVATLSERDMSNFRAVFKSVVMGDGTKVRRFVPSRH